ncbi:MULTISPECIES: site-specific integrase [Clostridium]|uniref:site-specific integrase n=1 Tax=Clostridium TaxID=1485 RepID=UPI000826FD68|nr:MULTISPECIES: site-specific integrase [Clostridium]PJI07653.1 site-specific integrase [Clostridium sp. CT7]
MNTVSPIRDKKQIELMKAYLKSHSLRDYLMFMVGISSALRISDILKLKILDVWNGKKPKEFIVLHEQKTGKYKKFPITKNLEKAIKEYLNSYDYDMNDYLIQSRKTSKGESKPITRQQAAFILSNAGEAIGLKEPISTHSMRKTWGYWAYKSGVSLALIMEALNHSSIANTKKYLGITQDDLNDVYMNLNL